jgi:hypothetical protein
VLAGQHDLQLPLVEGRQKRVHRLLEVGADVLTLAGELGAHLGVLEPLLELPERFDLLGETGAGLQDGLGARRIAPQIRVGDLVLDFAELAGARLEIKDAP